MIIDAHAIPISPIYTQKKRNGKTSAICVPHKKCRPMIRKPPPLSRGDGLHAFSIIAHLADTHLYPVGGATWGMRYVNAHRRQSPATLWHGWRGNDSNLQVVPDYNNLAIPNIVVLIYFIQLPLKLFLSPTHFCSSFHSSSGTRPRTYSHWDIPREPAFFATFLRTMAL